MPLVRTLRKLNLSRVDLVPKGSNPGAHIALFKEAPDDSGADKTNSPDSQGPTSSKENPMSQTATAAPEATEEVQPEATTTETAAEATTEVAPEATTETPAAAEVEKAEPETITKAEAEAILKDNADLRASVEKMQADKRRSEFIAKAEKDFGNLGNSVAIGEMLMKAEDNFGETESATLTTLLKALSEQAETGALFSQFAKGDAEGETPAERLHKRAKELVEKGEHPTIEQAKVAVMKADPELRKDYNESVRG